MDLDEDPAALFRSIFPVDLRNPYPKARLEQIHHNRTVLDGELFIDHLLSSIAHIENGTVLYPPKTITALKSLFTTIHTSAALDSLKKHTLTYYLLLDLRFATPSPPSSLLLSFQRKFLIPDNFIDLITALHSLDNLLTMEAMRPLTNPGIVVPLPEKVLRLLYSHGTPQQAVTFARTVQPALESEDAVKTYFRALLRLDVTAAFRYSRTAPDKMRPGLLEEVVEYCCSVNPAQNALPLLNLPLDEREKEVFVGALRGLGTEVARDTLMVWEMHQGMAGEALNGTSRAEVKGREVGGLDWGVLGEGLRRGLGSRMDV